MARVSKIFNAIINKDDRFWKSLCTDWWQNKQREWREPFAPLDWVQENAYSLNPMFTWKWFGKCFMCYKNLQCTPDFPLCGVSIGETVNGSLQGMGVYLCYTVVSVEGEVDAAISLEVGYSRERYLEGDGLVTCCGTIYRVFSTL